MNGNNEQFLNEVKGLSNWPCIDIKISPLAAFFLTTHVQLSCRHPSVTGDQITIVRGVIDQLIESLKISREFKLHLQKGWHPEFKLTIPQAPVERAKETAFSIFCYEWEIKPEWETYFKTEVTKNNEIVISVVELPELTFTLLVDEDGTPNGFEVALLQQFTLNDLTETLEPKFEESTQEIIQNKISAFPSDFKQWLENTLLKLVEANKTVSQQNQLGSFDKVLQDIPNEPKWMKINKRALLALVFAKSLMADFIADKTNQEIQFISNEFGELGFAHALRLTDTQMDDAIKSIVSSREYVGKTKP